MVRSVQAAVDAIEAEVRDLVPRVAASVWSRSVLYTCDVPSDLAQRPVEAAMTRVHEVTREQLRARRGEILDRVGVSYEVLARRATEYALVGEEWSAWDELRDIDFLLADAC
jgi:hypothetical protein